MTRPAPSAELDQQRGPATETGMDKGSIIITIDGPAGTGKSTVAQELAKRLGIDVLDTGAMYRAASAIVIDRNLDPSDFQQVVEVVSDADLHFDWAADPPTILAWLQPIDDRIRDEDVNALVPTIAAIGRLREHMVKKQRIIAQQHPRLISEGRDQGSVVFPDADAKFFLHARAEVRARRRCDQLRSMGRDADEQKLLENIRRRDAQDSTRADGPLICPEDAESIDTSDMTFDEVVNFLESRSRNRVPALSRS